MLNYKIYLGSDNKTKKIDDFYYKTAVYVLNKYVEGYTIYKGQGIWNGQTEDSLIIDIIKDKEDNSIKELAKELKEVLKQEAVLVVVNDINANFI